MIGKCTLSKTNEACETMMKEMVESLSMKNQEKEEKDQCAKGEAKVAIALLEKQVNEKVKAAVQPKNDVVVSKISNSEKKKEMLLKLDKNNHMDMKLKLEEKLSKTIEARENMTKEMVENLSMKIRRTDFLIALAASEYLAIVQFTSSN